jgi:hypothetical protein
MLGISSVPSLSINMLGPELGTKLGALLEVGDALGALLGAC